MMLFVGCAARACWRCLVEVFHEHVSLRHDLAEVSVSGGRRDGGKVRGGQARRHGQRRKEREKREHGLDAFARCEDGSRLAEADGVAEEMPHGPARLVERGFAAAVAGKPSALQAGDFSGEVRDGGQKLGSARAARAFMGTMMPDKVIRRDMVLLGAE